MIAEKLISDALVPLRTSDTGEDALALMNDFYVRHLPIVNNEELLGLLSEDDILENDLIEAVGSYQLSIQHPFVLQTDHIYDVMRLVAEFQLSVIPVVDEKRKYIGLITTEDLVRHLVEAGPFRDPGAILVLETTRQDYSLAEIARISESENAVILSSQVQTFADSPRVEVTLKLNKQNIDALISTFERFEFKIKASFHESTFFDGLKERYDSLITYLNV